MLIFIFYPTKTSLLKTHPDRLYEYVISITYYPEERWVMMTKKPQNFPVPLSHLQIADTIHGI